MGRPKVVENLKNAMNRAETKKKLRSHWEGEKGEARRKALAERNKMGRWNKR